MLWKRHIFLVLVILAASLGACSDDASEDRDQRSDAGSQDTGSEDTEPSDTGPEDTGPDDTGGQDARADGDASEPPPGCELPAPFDNDPAFPVDLYVSPNGDDNNTGREDDPFATLSHAAANAVQGTRIHLMAGTHAGGTHIGQLQGSEQAPISIIAEDGAVIEGGNTGLQLSEPHYVVLENLVIRNTAQNGLNIDDGGSFDTPAHHLVLRNITVEGVGDGGNQDCIKMSGVDDFWVLDSDVSECSGQGIDMVGCHDGVIAGNHIHDKPGAGVQAKGGTADILIHGNRIADVSGRGVNAGGSTGLEFFRPQDAPYEGARIQIVANIFERVGWESGAPVAFVGCDACLFAHNTVVEPQTWVARILQETVGDRFVPSRDGRFVNNIVAFNAADLRNGVFVNVGPNTAPETFTFANNLWYALDNPDFDGPTLSGGIPAPQNSVVQQDPGFADRAGGDYRIGTSSPAVGAARPLDDADFPGFDLPDYDGNCYGDPAAVGSFEGR